MKEHLWQGEWIADSELDARIAGLEATVNAEVAREPEVEPVLAASGALGERLRAGQAPELRRVLVDAGEITTAEIDATLAELGEFLRRDRLEKKLERELGSTRPFLAARLGSDDAVFEAWEPLGFLVHVSPQNAFTVGPLSVLEGLLAGNFCFLKTGGSESLFPQLFLKALTDSDGSGWLARRVIAARIPSKRSDRLGAVFSHADGVAAWGGEEAVRGMRALAPPGARVVEWGHRISFIYVARECAGDAAMIEQTAREVCWLEQQACSSPQCVYVETSSYAELERFGERLAAALGRVSPTIPAKLPDDAESAEISLVRASHRLEAAHGNARVIDGAGYRVFVDERPALAASPLYRTIWVKPLPRERILSQLRPMRRYLQTAGLSCGLSSAFELSRALRAAGVTRVRRVGEMLGSYPGEPHDGELALSRYCRRVGVQLPGAHGISSFDELRRLPPPPWKKPPAITPKSDFTPGDDPRARVFFKSGGTTGEPKLSSYSWEQYDEQMTYGAEGLVAAGFDPERDRAMNLFFGGGLYGGFVSFFSALERLGAVQFPMAGHADLGMVAETIARNRVNTLLGMPSYLLRLFEERGSELKAYGGVEKIFYGGEHFTDAQRGFLTREHGVKLIRSGAYGSVDIGPLGYQCEHSEGGVHHLQQKAQYLEILRVDEDRAVEGEEVGRLVFSPRSAGSLKPSRYEIGDLGQWVIGGCPCGRAAPRFRLLGRMGDVFRVGSMYLNYQLFARVASELAGFSSELQLVVEEDGLREKVLLLLSGEGAPAEACARLCLEHYEDLREAVVVDRVLAFEARAVPPSALERARGSGKLVRVVDRRRRS
jgi:phenylacetate-coenzyme A ligase PaaK-like adenylate-forming protein